MTIFTIGHSTRTEQEVRAILRAANVAAVVDVRAIPSSRRHPQFNKGTGALEEWLAKSDVSYEHRPELGGRRRPAAPSPNAGWRVSAFQGYADHMDSEEFAAGLAALEQLARSRPTAVMCAEALWWRCHRRLIADALTVRGWRVEHLGVGNEPAIHELPPFAVVENGTVSYPPPQSSLL